MPYYDDLLSLLGFSGDTDPRGAVGAPPTRPMTKRSPMPQAMPQTQDGEAVPPPSILQAIDRGDVQPDRPNPFGPPAPQSLDEAIDQRKTFDAIQQQSRQPQSVGTWVATPPGAARIPRPDPTQGELLNKLEQLSMVGRSQGGPMAGFPDAGAINPGLLAAQREFDKDQAAQAAAAGQQMNAISHFLGGQAGMRHADAAMAQAGSEDKRAPDQMFRALMAKGYEAAGKMTPEMEQNYLFMVQKLYPNWKPNSPLTQNPSTSPQGAAVAQQSPQLERPPNLIPQQIVSWLPQGTDSSGNRVPLTLKGALDAYNLNQADIEGASSGRGPQQFAETVAKSMGMSTDDFLQYAAGQAGRRAILSGEFDKGKIGGTTFEPLPSGGGDYAVVLPGGQRYEFRKRPLSRMTGAGTESIPSKIMGPLSPFPMFESGRQKIRDSELMPLLKMIEAMSGSAGR